VPEVRLNTTGTEAVPEAALVGAVVFTIAVGQDTVTVGVEPAEITPQEFVTRTIYEPTGGNGAVPPLLKETLPVKPVEVHVAPVIGMSVVVPSR